MGVGSNPTHGMVRITHYLLRNFRASKNCFNIKRMFQPLKHLHACNRFSMYPQLFLEIEKTPRNPREHINILRTYLLPGEPFVRGKISRL